jgi:hypothetical protein
MQFESATFASSEAWQGRGDGDLSSFCEQIPKSAGVKCSAGDMQGEGIWEWQTCNREFITITIVKTLVAKSVWRTAMISESTVQQEFRTRAVFTSCCVHSATDTTEK